MANKFLSGINVTGTTTLNTVANAGTDTDKFLVLDASGNVDFRTGAELYADLGIGDLPSGFTSTLKHAVKAGVALTKGQAVYVTSADGTNMIVGKASNASEATSSKTMGLIETTLSINGIGNVITEGLLTGLDTTGATNAGDPVWLGTDGNLIYGLLNKPYAPANLVFIGVVTRINANNGEIFVKVQNGFEMNELHDVDLKTTTPINGHILGYNGTLWVNKTIAGWLGYTPSNDTNVVHLAGTETITGAKTFSLAVSAHEGIAFLNGVMPPITSSYYSGIGGNSNGISIVTRPVSTNYTNNLYFAASNNSFTFPNATGTIALTSNIPSITGLVPYTGANSTVNLGSNTLIVREMQIWKGLNNDVDSTAIGRESLASTTSSDANTAFGDLSLRMNTTGSYNTAAGCQALMNNTTGSYNTAFGTFSLGGGGIGGFSGGSNTAVGYLTGCNITTGSGNTFIGRQAGNDVTTGNYNVILGSYFGTAAMTGNVILADGEGNIRFQWDGTNIKLNGNTVGSNAFTSTAFVPQTRTLTINGTAYDLSADRSWTVTSMVYPGAGIAVSTGTAWGTSLTDNSANWNTAYGWGNHASAGYLTGISSLLVISALGYTPYNSTNPAGYITSSGSISGAAGSVSGLTLTNSSNGINPDSVSQNQIGYNTSVSLFGQSDGGLYSSAYNSSWIHQIYGDFRTGQIAIRGKQSGSWTGWRTVIDSGNIGSQSVSYANSAGSASSASSASYAGYLPTLYAGGVQSNPQVYFNNGIGLRVAMTGHWSVWSDTMWINGYSGGDVPWMCALHFLRNSEPRFAISAQTQGSGSYGTVYEVITSYNIASQTVANLSGFNKSEPTFANVFNTGWFRNYGDSGLYNQDYGCHLRRNTSSSHGSWEIFGYTKGGYVGLNCQDPQGYNNNLMFENGQGGIYVENGSGWTIYLSRPNDCVGINGSETYDWVRACTNGKHRITNDTWCDATSWAYTFSNISDERLKENIITVDSALDKVLQLRGVYYNWIIDTENRRHIGLIAQETAAVCPEVVNYHDETDTYSVNYSELSGLFIESTKELNQKLIDANSRIELLEAKLNQLLNA